MAKISVLTPSIRPQYLDIAQKCLEKQTYQSFEWITEIGLRNRGFDLPAAWNRLIKRSSGEIIVMYQDCITIPDNALELIASLDHTKCAYTYPVSKNDKPDWRHYSDDIRGTKPIPKDHWEIDFASAPRSLFFDVGGFDETYCDGWSWENVEIGWRAHEAGYTFYCVPNPAANAFDHDALIENPYRNKLRNNDWRVGTTMTMAQMGNWKQDWL